MKTFLFSSGILPALDKSVLISSVVKKLLCFIMDCLDQMHLCSNSFAGNIDTIYSAMTQLFH